MNEEKHGAGLSDMEEVIDRHGDHILRLCLLYLGNRPSAEDAFQETMLKAWTHRSDFRGECALGTWLTRIAINVCRDMLRSRSFLLFRHMLPDEVLENIPAPDLPSAEAGPDVRSAVARLPRRYREVVILSYYEDCTAAEIAALLHIPRATVDTRLRRARIQLKDMLKEDLS